MAVFRSLAPNDGRRHGVRHVLFGTLPGRAIVIGIVLRIAVYLVERAARHGPRDSERHRYRGRPRAGDRRRLLSSSS